jgi:serine phosphatase RsbU (regulator of sigma subunit)
MNQLINKISELNKPLLFILTSLILLLIGFLDLITGVEVSISIFYLIPIAISSYFINELTGFFVSLLSSVVFYLADLFASHSYRHPLTPYWNALVMLGTFILFSKLLSELKKAIEKENIMALQTQQSLLPQKDPEICGYSILSIWQPAKVVSGDSYDFIPFGENKLGISLADTCGHGYPAALLMSNLQASFRIIADNHRSPEKVCSNLNKIITSYEIGNKFISFFYGILDTNNRTFIYSNAGHPPPIVLRSTGDNLYLSRGGLLFGVNSEAPYELDKVHLEKGDRIFLFTDGIIETRNSAGEEFGEDRMLELLKRCIKLPVNDFRKKVLDTINRFGNGYIADDITLLVVSVNN